MAKSDRVRRPDWVGHVLDDAVEPPRAVLLHLPSGRRTALSETGTRVWQTVVDAGDTGVDAEGIATTLAPEYGTVPGAIVADISALLVEMLDGDWLAPVPPPESATGR